MRSHSRRNIVPPRRHDLVSLDPQSWTSIIEDNPCLCSEPLIAEWRRHGWPVVARRPEPGGPAGISVGLPLPPSAGKKRLSLVIQEHQILSVDRPPVLEAVHPKSPSDWIPTLREIGELASRHAIDVRVFGSLGWSAITGLDYLTSSSDLDFLFYLYRNTNAVSLANDLAGIQSMAPMRLDGEFIRYDGAGVHWREFLGATGDILVKSISGTMMCHPTAFLNGDTNL
ncbi:malonate decarboxylase holo-[acyl-carrier-protein] synthase [Rhizobium viscosum]|uniref:Phosphoribosyl-dephospho-CoA transferase n=1 Tax=Rhizobium viscosum TaxID=1673 RepID=A0ABR9IXN3_RHIVS|nr:malonate decarboxylase holo-[acyl-carrier-protein] synthase [Rhizobium viscosum]MBE1507991.1 phosphoribosyl-dephospho-CoA transferase [Rhizobium viscosum]